MVFVSRPDGKKRGVRSKRRWEDNIKIVLHEVGWGGMDWIDLVRNWDR
jgi:hypothetical protein